MKVYSHYLDPKKYPTFRKRAEKPVTNEQLGNTVQFSACRSFPVDPKTNRLYAIEETICKYTKDYDMCRMFWLHYKNFLADNVEELLEALKAHDLYLYGGWGFVPGGIKSCDVDSAWGEFSYSKELDEKIRSIMGDNFLGYEMGEQDGRYNGAYVSREDAAVYPKTRVGQMKNFDRWHGRIAEQFHNKLTVLSALNFTHYNARGGYATMLSCEAAQHLGNSQMWYAFLRGAAKQYGILLGGNVSVWKIGSTYKYYGKPGLPEAGGPEKGTSLSMLRRILWNEYMYNCVFLGYENSWFDNDDSESHILGTYAPEDAYAPAGICPIGQIQMYAKKRIEELGKPGVMYTPVALMMDAFAGWNPPASSYTSKLYEVWGNIPYNNGDFQSHAFLEMLFPRYEDSGLYHDETGLLCSTRYGEMTDVLLSDADGAILNQYRLLVLVNDTAFTVELQDKVRRFVDNGGHVVLWAPTVLQAKNAVKQMAYFGIQMAGGEETVSGTAVYGDKEYPVTNLTLLDVLPTEDAVVEATVEGKPAIITTTHGDGRVTVILAETGLEEKDIRPAVGKVVDTSIPQAYVWSPFVEAYLGDCLDSYTLVKPTDEALQYIVNVKDEKTLLLQVSNNSYTARRYDVVGAQAEIVAIKPILIEDDVQDAVGYYPACVEVDAAAVVGEGAYTIAAGDVVMYEVALCDPLELQAESVPAANPRKVGVRMPMSAVGIRDFLIENPTFQQYFDTLLVDALYLERMDKKYLTEEAAWLHRYGIKLSVDFTRLLNTYPDLRFEREYPEMREASFARLDNILDKFSLYDGDAVFMARNLTANSGKVDMAAALVDLAQHVRAVIPPEVKLYCHNRGFTAGMGAQLGPVKEMDGVALAWDTSAGLGNRIPGPLDLAEVQKDYTFSALLLSAPTFTITGNPQNGMRPVVGSGLEAKIKEALDRVEGDVYLAADYTDWDEIYADYRYLFG